MKDQEINNQIMKTIESMDSMENIKTSPNWNRNLMNKIASTRQSSVPVLLNRKAAFILFILFLLNVGVILNLFFNSGQNADKRKTELKTLSNDLLINPGSISN